MYVFFDVFEKVKKCIFASKFLKTGPMDLKICAKKTCNLSGFPPKILSKSSHFSKIYDILKSTHFFFDLTVRNYAVKNGLFRRKTNKKKRIFQSYEFELMNTFRK